MPVTFTARLPAATLRATLLAFVALLVSLFTAPPSGAADSADRMILWVPCGDVVALSDAELDTWRDRGVDGFVCMAGHLRGLGGSQDFTGDPNASLSSSNYELQRSIRDSNIVARAGRRGMKLYLGVKLVNYYNPRTPLVDWFDEDGWSRQVLPKMRDLAAAAHLHGFAGLTFDQELYPQKGGVTSATWSWNYPGNTHTEQQVRAMAQQRGEQLMATILGVFPQVEIATHWVRFSDSWLEFVQRDVNGFQNTYASRLDVDFWDGMTRPEGYGAIRMFNSGFYKDSHRANWDDALRYEQNRVYAYLSRELSNWDYASSRVHLSPFSWIDAGPKPSAYDDARPPAYVAEQLRAFSRWGAGGEFANFVYGGLGRFDFGPYAGAMRAASAPVDVDRSPPSLQGTRVASGALAGTASDNLAIRVVRWSDDRGRSGAAELTWQPSAGEPATGTAATPTRWTIGAKAPHPKARSVRVWAEDIKGYASQPTQIQLRRSSGPRTRITRHPKRTIRRRTATFRFTADQPVAGYRCKLDRRRWQRCDRGKTRLRVGRGGHRFRVAAVDSEGRLDRTPAKHRFRVKA